MDRLFKRNRAFWKVPAILGFASLLTLVLNCGVQEKPSSVVESMCRTTERGEIDSAAAFMSQGMVTREGIDRIKESLRQTALWIKNDGGIKSIKVLNEDTVGNVAEVTIEVTRGGGDSSVVHYRLIREQGDWKIDGLSAEPTSTPMATPSVSL
jgi:hypothetical protein